MAIEQRKLYVIFVLDEATFGNCHIVGAINVLLPEVESFVKTLDKDAVEIVVYCSNYMCEASNQAARKIKGLGYKVSAYKGGIAEWYQLGFPVKGACTDSFLTNKMSKAFQVEDPEIEVITAEQLLEKMKGHRLL